MIRENKNKEYLTPTIKIIVQMLQIMQIIQMSQKFIKITSNSEQVENTKSAERQKTSFPKEYR